METDTQKQGFPFFSEWVRGEWRQIQDGYFYIVQCPVCQISISIELTGELADDLGLEGAEEKIERTAAEVWMNEDDCRHIQFKENA